LLAQQVHLSGNAADAEGIRQLTSNLARLAQETTGAGAELTTLGNALQHMNETDQLTAQSLGSVVRMLTEVETTAARIRAGGGLGTTLAASPTASQQAAAAATAAANQETQARSQARRELEASIATLGRYGRLVDATSAEAVAAWRAEAVAIRQQAESLGLSRDAMLRFEQTLETTETRFARVGQAQGAYINSQGLLTERSQRMANGAIAVSFALEAVASGATKADTGMVTLLRTVASLGVAFGPQGLVVSGIASATAAIIQMTRSTNPAEQAVRAYVQELQGINGAAASASTAVRNLTAAQREQRTFLLQSQLFQAQQDIGQLKQGILQSLDTGSFKTRLSDFFSLEGIRNPEAIGNFLRDMQGVRNQVIAGQLSMDQLGAAVIRVAEKYPQLRNRIREVVDNVVKLQSLRDAITGTQNALDQTRQAPTGGFDTGMREQLENARALAVAYRSGGDAAKQGLAAAQQAFMSWRDNQRGVVSETLTFQQALKGLGGETAQNAARAFQRDATELARLAQVAQQAKTELSDAERALKAFADRVEKSGALEIKVTAQNPTVALEDVARRSTQLLTSKLAAVPLQLDTAGAQAGLHDLEVSIQAVRTAEQDLDFAKAFGNVSAIAGATGQLRDAQQAAQAFARAMLPVILAIQDPVLQKAVLARFVADLKDIGTVAPKVDHLSTSLRTIGTAVRGVLQVADAFGDVDQSVRKSIDGVAGLLDGLASAREALKDIKSGGSLLGSTAGIASVVGIVGASASIVAGLAGLLNRGPNPELVAIQRKNNDLLADLNSKLSGYANSLSTLSNAVDRLGGIDLGGAGAAARGTQIVAGNDAGIRYFNRLIAETGLTFADLNRLAKDNGIELLDSKGRLSAEALEHFTEILAATRDAALRWGNTLDDLTSQRDLFRDIHDIDTSGLEGMTRVVLDSADILKGLAPALYHRIFDGLDLTTVSGRNLLNDRLNQIIDEELTPEFQRGEGWLAELMKQSGFTNLADFNKWLLSTDNALDQFTKTTLEATDALGNVPDAFKNLLAQDRFRAIAPTLPPGSGLTPQPLSPPTAPMPTGNMVVQNYQPGSVVISADGLSQQDVYETWEREAQRRARAANGALAPTSAAWAPR
jgi:hypothetical protein